MPPRRMSPAAISSSCTAWDIRRRCAVAPPPLPKSLCCWPAGSSPARCSRSSDHPGNHEGKRSYPMKKLLILGLGALLLTSAALPAAAFERVGDRKIIVFGGRQQVPVLDPHVRYD